MKLNAKAVITIICLIIGAGSAGCITSGSELAAEQKKNLHLEMMNRELREKSADKSSRISELENRLESCSKRLDGERNKNSRLQSDLSSWNRKEKNLKSKIAEAGQSLKNSKKENRELNFIAKYMAELVLVDNEMLKRHEELLEVVGSLEEVNNFETIIQLIEYTQKTTRELSVLKSRRGEILQRLSY
ncbi:hypothetical protein SAMN02746065_1208 [Desulfocicer vacuolatum DSM 3385]|uniref:Uncharacterized protein n=1 Tax=Desulfocicer vacuolatum DSM 3385 TaxID=1121400 RepID=A0A1W2DS54_9BACT|nr:hypothetical protein [Desulfocicer vacuolatum]SMD00219.1 hypothetical protein SAMN02746065_1208 [Desulfocicer vacuolatum DSM 3385]